MQRILTVVGLALLGGAVAVWVLFVPRDAGDIVDALPPPAVTPTSVVTLPQITEALPAAGPATTTTSPEPLLEAEPGQLPDVAERNAPVRLTIPALGIEAPIIALGVDDEGRMDIPRDVGEVGWYRYGPTPGDRGSAVLAAHVDSRSQGPGVFFRLGTLTPGDFVEVETEEGSQTWVVRAVETIEKDELPLDRVFARGGEPVLTLITCGGSFSRSLSSYDSNVVVVAVPLVDSPASPGPVG
jgi:LPXTG-site transpeptidase (sortase) family protein